MNSSPAPAKEIAPDSSFHLLILGFSVLAPIRRLNHKGFRTFINRYEWTMASCFTPPKGSRVSYNQWLEEAADDLRRSISFNLPCRPLRIS